MECDRAMELLNLELDGELSAEEQAELEEYLRDYPGCRQAREQLRAAEEAFRACEAEVPAALHSRVMDAVHEEKQKKQQNRRQWFTVGLVAAAAAALAILSGVGLLQTPGAANGENAVSIAGAFSRLEISTEFAPEDAAEKALAQEYAEKNNCPVLVIWQDGEAVGMPMQKIPAEVEPGLTIFFTTNRKLNALAAQQKQNRVRLYVPEGASRRGADDAIVLVIQK